ncbi:MAG: mannosyltransferase, partial [Bacteroidia bacterium]|nr:mannosyltransferase [Bacteroidia bacterium]
MNNKNTNQLYVETHFNLFRHFYIDQEPAVSLVETPLTEVLFITSFPPRECGIATYSQDLISALNDKFENSFKLSICPVESDAEQHLYNHSPDYVLNTDRPECFTKLAKSINTNANIGLVLIQHEFGFFTKQKKHFTDFVDALAKPLIIVFHTVLPKPDDRLKAHVIQLSEAVATLVVMTQSSRRILMEDYGMDEELIQVIPHGTHLVSHTNKHDLKRKYKLSGRSILSTFGLLSSGKSIETTLNALPEIIKLYPNVLFLIIGKTHPGIIKQEGENYRNSLMALVEHHHLQQHVLFVNQFLSLPVLLEYLQLTDIYLFTSK